MIKYLTTLFVIALNVSGQISFKFDKEFHNIDTLYIKYDSLHNYKGADPIHVDFTLTNTGKELLIIERSWGNGRCTANYQQNPILPGKSAVIKVTYYQFPYTYSERASYIKGSVNFETNFFMRLIQGDSVVEKKLSLRGYRKEVIGK
jgi:hypothetical protein